MNFTVGWDQDAYTEFLQLWVTSPDPAAVRAARESAERALGADPFGVGRHLAEGLWQLHVPPLVVCYTVDLDRRHIEISDVFLPPDVQPTP